MGNSPFMRGFHCSSPSRFSTKTLMSILPSRIFVLFVAVGGGDEVYFGTFPDLLAFCKPSELCFHHAEILGKRPEFIPGFNFCHIALLLGCDKMTGFTFLTFSGGLLL